MSDTEGPQVTITKNDGTSVDGTIHYAIVWVGKSMSGHDELVCLSDMKQFQTDAEIQLAWDVLEMAELGGMPDTFWSTDSRIANACKAIGMNHVLARRRIKKVLGR